MEYGNAGSALMESRFFSPIAADERRWFAWGSILVFTLALITYWLTVAPSVSYWDCPEYVLTAARLEVGHPPGNPTWTLFHRIVTLFSGDSHAALAINLTSGIFTALAAMLLFRTVAFLAYRWLKYLRCKSLPLACTGAMCAAMMFAWCDSTWYSAVEAEVYAMSVFLTALTVWLMLRWAQLDAGPSADRMLLLIAYVTGLSLGVHQLNLLVLPALACIYVWRRTPRPPAWRRLFGTVSFSFIAIVCILKGIMPGTVWMAGLFELFFVNTLGAQYSTGALVYIALLASVAVFTLLALWRINSSPVAVIAAFPLLLMSGAFMFGRSPVLSVTLSAIVCILGVAAKISARTVNLGAWALTLILVGYSSLLLIPIRSAADPPVNEGDPSDVFSLYRYIEREQYGSKPLLRGRTPYSRAMAVEEFSSDSTPTYTRIALKKGRPLYVAARQDAVLWPRSGFVTAQDSTDNAVRMNGDADAYLLADYTYSQITTPELDMWLPRIVGNRKDDIDSYASWVGMDTSTMTRVAVTEAFDSLGNHVNRLDADAQRPKKYSYRPTYLQNLRFFLGYQAGYMYFRYLLWNFSGRQNDITSSGETDHGNFLTGIPLIDDAMVGPLHALPPEAGNANRGHNVYYMLPLLLCVAGMVTLCRGGRAGARICTGITILFIMTGVAIVVYLNQDTGEPRERDYSFLGSFYAFAAWGGFGAIGVGLFVRYVIRFLRCVSAATARRAAVIAATACLAVPVLMFAVNYDDHDRSHRNAATDFTVNILQSMPEGAILFTDGDNYTFPLWYVQEVLGVRRDVTVVNLSYLALPSYVAQLQRGSQDARPVAMTATPSQLLYGRYSLVRTPQASPADTLPLLQVLRDTYASSVGAPRMSARCAWLKADSDSVLVDFRDMASAGGGTHLTLRQLAMLDIVATNTVSASPRPVYWLAHLPDNAYSGMRRLTEPRLFGRRLAGIDEIPAVAWTLDSMRWGGFELADPPYADPTVQSQASFQRVALVREGERLLKEGDPYGALRYALAVEKYLSGSASNFGYASYGGKIAWDGEELARLLINAGTAAGDSAAVARGRLLLRGEKSAVSAWRRYYNSLPPRLQPVVSFKTMRILSREIN